MDAERLKKIGMFTIGGILSGIIGNLIKGEYLLNDFRVSAIAGLSAGVILEIFDESPSIIRVNSIPTRRNMLRGRNG